MSQYDPGDKVNVDLVRGDDHKNIVVTLKNKEGNTNILIKETNDVVESLGIRYEDLSDREAGIISWMVASGSPRYTVARSLRRPGSHEKDSSLPVWTVNLKRTEMSWPICKLKNKSGENVIVEGIIPAYPNKIYNYGISL